MGRTMVPFRRSDGLHEVAIIGNVGLESVYSSTEKVTHFIEDTDVDTDSVHSDQLYIQLDDNFSEAAYNPKGVHLLRNITTNGDTGTYEYFAESHNRDNQDNWLESKCPSGDFENLKNRDKLIPMKIAKSSND